MTERERWAVYPLLFLTLGIAVKDKLTGVVHVDNVQCRNLLCNAVLVTDRQGKQQVVVSSSAGGGLVRTMGNAGQVEVIVGHTKRLAGLLFVDAEGQIRNGSIAIPAGGPAPAPPDEPPPVDAQKTPQEKAP
jgi:hypothetical protein